MPTRDDVIAELTGPGGLFEFALDESQGWPIRVFKSAPASLRQVLLETRANGDRPFMIYGEEVLTYEEHFQRVAALAHRLRALGVGMGDRVAIGMRNYPEWSIAWWACHAIGAIAVALNAWWTTAELAFALKDSEPAALLIDGERLERLAGLIADGDFKAVGVARRGGAGAGGTDFAELTAGPQTELPDTPVEPNDLATILYTSGTTGNPKGAMATHRNHVTNLMNSRLAGAVGRVMLGLPAETPPPGAPDAPPQGGVLQTFPFFHIGGLSGLYIGAGSGAKLALMYKWSPVEAVQLVETHGLMGVSGVPIVVRQFLEAATSMGASLSSVMAVASGGAPVPPDLIRRIGDQFQQRAAPGNGYGLTETTSAVIVNGGPDYLAQPDSVGRPVACADARIVGEDGQDKPVGEVGEVWIRGPNVIPGYWRNPEATEAAFGGGWFRTGDLGYRDERGLYYVVDRMKDVIIRGGENVYCAEVEAAILEQPGVKDACVLGLAHKDWGEEVAAIIQLPAEACSDARAGEIVEAISANLARFKLPTQVKVTPDDLARTATGKLLKRDLRGQFFGQV